MKNLAHIPIDILEENPSRLSMRWPHHTSLAPYKARHRIYAYRYGAKQYILGRKIKNLIKGSVGKNWDDVYSKIKSYTIGLRFEHDLKWWLRHDICVPVWSYKFQRWEVHSYYLSHNEELSEYIQRVRRKSKYYGDSFYYVCPVSNEIRVVKPTVEGIKKDSDHWRRHYTFQKDRRRKRKERNKEEYEHILRMINNPQLFEFYKSICQQYKSLVHKLEKYEQKLKDPYEVKKQKFYLPANWYKLSSEELYKMESLKNQIKELEAGNFNGFFESGVYLYSQQKECHHFAQP